MTEPGLVLSAVVTFVALVAWAVRQEGRINSHDKELLDHAKKHDELREDISYIRNRIDSAVGRHHL